MNIVLCGMPLSGKTTVGKLLAKTLNKHFIDTDRLIEEAYLTKTGISATCRQIALKEGQEAFRCLEKNQISKLIDSHDRVIALGGGSVEFVPPEIIRSLGWMVYLNVPFEIVWDRMQKSNGIYSYLDPQDPAGSLKVVMQRRQPLFEKTADRIVDTSERSLENIVEEIIKRWEMHGQ